MTFDEFKQQALQDPTIRAEYDALENEFAQIRADLDAKRETPNAETLAAFAEIENGGGHIFTGTTQALFTELI